MIQPTTTESLAHFVTDTNARLAARHVEVENVNFIVTPPSGVEEVVLHVDSERGRIKLPMALSAQRTEDARIVELRIYFSTWPLIGHHAVRPPLLQPDPDLDLPEVVAAYHRALAAGDVAAAVAAFEPGASVCEPRGGPHVHRGTNELEALHERFFSNGGGIEMEPCAVTDDGRACALEYNLVAWGRTQLLPQAGLAVYVRGEGGKLAAARISDNADPPLRVEALATGVR
jgi:hypothetical protein